jgi:hypothetical protein
VCSQPRGCRRSLVCRPFDLKGLPMCRLDAPPWGLCPGLLAAWNLARHGDGWRRPDVLIDTSEALTALAYHPTAPVSQGRQ